MRTLNLGILAHVDAGKTSLTERLLYTAGVIDEIGSVDAGSTQTDSLELERRRGITIKSAVVSFAIDEVTVNLIDTPGHPDFIAEVERVLSVLDGAVLVVSAVEGVQSQTRVLYRALQRLRIPTLIFVNKTDRRGARPEAVVTEVAEKLGRPAYRVCFGSAITGAGVAELMTGITELLPCSERDASGPVSGTVFKVERGPAGQKVAYVRMFSGAVRVRDRIVVAGSERKVTAIGVFDRGAVARTNAVSAGQIAKVSGLGDVRIGDEVGVRAATATHHFPPPTLESVVVPRRPADKGALHTALAQLAEQDPLINLRQDDLRQELSLSLYGEVQKEVIEATLAEDYGVAVEFRESTTICIERPAGCGAAYELIGKEPNPFLATVGLRVEPAAVGSGVGFRLGVELGSMPLAFVTAVEDTVRATLREGLMGWDVTDCLVTMTHSGYYARQGAHSGFDKSKSSTGWDFRGLTPLVLMDALQRAGTVVCEPVHRFQLEVPVDVFGSLLPVLGALGAVPRETKDVGAAYVVEGEIPAARVHELQQRLPGLTRGEGLLESVFDRYEPVRGRPTSRPRTDANPLCRKEYLLHTLRRV